jgi:hypothetical protein
MRVLHETLIAACLLACKGSSGGGTGGNGTGTGTDTGSGTGTGDPAGCAARGEQIFAQGMLHRVEITVSETNWQALVDQAVAYSEDEDTLQTYFEAVIKYDDLPEIDGIGIRIKGNHAVQNAIYLGKSLPLKVDFDRFKPDQTLDGLKKINLHAMVNEEEGWEWPSDPIADYVSYTAMRAHGAAASRVTMAEVFVNGESQGLYSVVEQVSGGFIKCNFEEPWGDLYKPDEPLTYEGDSIDDYPEIEFKWPDVSDHGSVLALIRTLDEGSNADLEEVLDIDGALSYFALNIGLGNWDYYTFITHNYYLYEASPGRFTMIPWDMNMSQVDWTQPCGVGAGDSDTPVSARLLADEDYVARYVEILRSFLEGAGSVEAQHGLVDEISPLVGDWITQERLDNLRQNISTRVPGMLAELDGLTVCPDWTDWE